MKRLSALQVAISPAEKFREFLARNGQRYTHERKIIVDAVFSSHEHFDADYLVERLGKREGKRVSRASVYRSLALLEESGLLRKVTRSNGRDVFEHDYGYPQHDHMICRKCGSMIEFRADAISELLERVVSDHGFRMTGHRLEVTGICAACSGAPRRQRREPKHS